MVLTALGWGAKEEHMADARMLAIDLAKSKSYATACWTIIVHAA